MNVQLITTEFADEFPVQPWAVVVRTAAGTAAGSAEPAGFVPDAPVRPQRDRGASAVEWVIITGIVVAIVVGVGVAIKAAITTKANQTSTDIGNAGSSAGNGGGAPTTGQ